MPAASLERGPVTIVDLLSMNEGSEIDFEPGRLGMTARTPELYMSWTPTWCPDGGFPGDDSGELARSDVTHGHGPDHGGGGLGPVLPPLPISRGTKSARATTWKRVSSK
jgi:hypothetical protein